MAIIRFILGKIILFLDALFTPKSIQRDPAKQTAIEKELKSLSLYELEACPFCVKVRRAAKRLNLPLERRDIGKVAAHAKDLVAQGGEDQVPCLRIEGEKIQWLYESSEIIAYLEKRYG